MATYGYGKTLGLLIIYPPQRNLGDSLFVQGRRVKGFIQTAIEEDYIEYGPDGSREIAEVLYPFAGSENGEYFAWLTGKTLLSHPEEYPIYRIAAKMAGIKYATNSLDELLTSLCSPKVKNILGPGYSPLPATFQPSNTTRSRL